MRRIALLFLLFFSLPSLAVDPKFISCAELLRQVSKHDLSSGDYAVDLELGIVQIVRIDESANTAVVFNRELDQPQVTLANFSRRPMAKVGSRRASQLIQTRIHDYFGIDNVVIYFGLYAVLTRMREASPFAYKTEYTEIIRKYYPTDQFARVEDALQQMRNVAFRRAKPNDWELSHIWQMLTEMSAITRENLIHSGILGTFARERIDNWTWPMRGGPYSFNTQALGRFNARLGVPRDVDHYARSWIWRESRDILKYPPAKDLGLATHFVLTRKPSPAVPDHYLIFGQLDPYWPKIFSVANTLEITPSVVANKHARYIIAERDPDLALRLAAEVRRVAFNYGALSVEVFVRNLN